MLNNIQIAIVVVASMLTSSPSGARAICENYGAADEPTMGNVQIISMQTYYNDAWNESVLEFSFKNNDWKGMKCGAMDPLSNLIVFDLAMIAYLLHMPTQIIESRSGQSLKRFCHGMQWIKTFLFAK